MNDEPSFYRLGGISVIDVSGADADTIVHNLTTNEVKSIAVGEGRESFVTEVRGKTVGHVSVFRHPEFLRMIGPAGQSDRIAAHLDRYTIREDAVATVRDDDFVALVLAPRAVGKLDAEWSSDVFPTMSHCQLAGVSVDAYQTLWLGEGSAVILVPSAEAENVTRLLADQVGTPGDEAGFHHHRTLAGFPWFGIDLNESNLPQEADRDSVAVSFTKGCYLGQETVARLDAMGQVQKKLVRWSITGTVPPAGTALTSGEKTVGRLTSVAAVGDADATAIGLARRSHFDAGSVATGVVESSGIEFEATVL